MFVFACIIFCLFFVNKLTVMMVMVVMMIIISFCSAGIGTTKQKCVQLVQLDVACSSPKMKCEMHGHVHVRCAAQSQTSLPMHLTTLLLEPDAPR